MQGSTHFDCYVFLTFLLIVVEYGSSVSQNGPLL